MNIFMDWWHRYLIKRDAQRRYPGYQISVYRVGENTYRIMRGRWLETRTPAQRRQARARERELERLEALTGVTSGELRTLRRVLDGHRRAGCKHCAKDEDPS